MPRPTPAQSHSGKVVVPHEPRRSQVVASRILFVLEEALTSLIRFEWHDESGFFQPGPVRPVIFCLWHNRLALSMAIFRRFVRKHQPERRLAALVSASKDGAFLAAVLEQFGVQPVRGSTSRRGPQALLELTSWADRGYDLAITPDGPRGPRCVVQTGVIVLAQLTGLPIVPATSSVSRKIRLRSWDQFQLPLPLSRCVIRFGPPVFIPRDATEPVRHARREALEAWLRQHD